MADQTGGSPWDEPLPEIEKPKKQTPTVVGNLDVQSNQQSNAQSQPQVQELKVPADTTEKVGAKISIINQPLSGVHSQPEPPKPQVEVSQTQPTQPSQTVETPDPEPNFWQSVYGAAEKFNPTADQKQDTISPQNVAAALPAGSGKTVQKLNQNVQPQSAVPISPQTEKTHTNQTTNVQTPSPTKSKQPFFSNKLNLVIAGLFGVLVLFAGGIFLTEQGLISIGLEKIYGLARLESLWGGLPANAENAFLLSAEQMKNQSSFKTTGSLTATVNSGVKSNAISPIVSGLGTSVISLKDQSVAKKIQAVLTLSDDEIDTNELEIEEVETSSADDSSTQTSSNNTNNSSVLQDDENSSTGGQEIAPGSSSSNSSNQSIVKELSADISASISNDVSGADISFTNSSNQNSSIQLIYSNKKLYFKTSGNISYASGAKGGWLSTELNNISSEGPSNDLWSADFTSSAFSIVGNRLGSQSVNGVRCFHYSGQANIGDSLQNFGIGNSEISNVDFEYWIGIKDHLIYKTNIKIVTNSQSAISQIDLSLNYSDYGSADNQYTVPATSSPYSTQSAPSSALETAKGRDSQRKTDLSSIAQALESYHNATGKYPAVNGVAKISSDTGIVYSALVPNYISKLPIDPVDPKHYYGYESDGKTYKLSAVLEDPADTSGKKVGNILIYYLSSL